MEEAPKVAEVLETFLRCPYRLSQSELAQVNQGAFRAVLAFLAQRVRDPMTVRQVRAAALLKTRSMTVYKVPRTDDLRQVLASREVKRRQTYTEVQAVRTNQLRTMAMEVFHSKVHRLIEQIRLFSLPRARIERDSELNLKEFQNYSEMLLSLFSQNKELPTHSLKGLFEASGLKASKPQLIEALTQAVTSQHFDFEHQKLSLHSAKSAAHIVTRLKSDLESSYTQEWKEFMALEAQITEIRCMQQKYKSIKTAADNSATSSKQLRALQEHRIKVSGLRAAKRQIEICLTSLKDREKDLSQILQLRKSQSQRFEAIKTEAEFLQGKAKTATEQNAILRKTIAKFKLRVHEFLQKHVISMKEKLPKLAQPLFNCVTRELEMFQNWQPNSRPRSVLTDPLLSDVYQLSSVSPYKPFSDVISKLTDIPADEFEPDLPSKDLALPSIDLSTSATTPLQVEAIRDLMQEWITQGGQLCIPWRKDSFGRNIQDWLSIWRPIALQQQYEQ